MLELTILDTIITFLFGFTVGLFIVIRLVDYIRTIEREEAEYLAHMELEGRFKIIESIDDVGIVCFDCDHISYHPDDVEKLYCPNCKTTHTSPLFKT